jgi:peptidyl-prolyl cis-trans isomerase C
MTRTSCSVQSVLASVPRIVVGVNGVAIPHDLISREAQNHPSPTPLGAWNAAARALVVRELLLQEARRLDLRPSPAEDAEGRRETDEEALIRSLIDSQVETPEPDEASCRRYYDNNRARFRSADIWECSHILIAARRDRSEAFAAARRKAEALRTQLRDAPHAFAALASAHSDCPSRANGGNLGQVTRGMTTPEFERALLSLSEGEIGPPVESRYGFHIVRLERRIAGESLPFEVVHARIAAWLAERSQRLAMAQYVARLAAQAKVTGVELASPGDLGVL